MPPMAAIDRTAIRRPHRAAVRRAQRDRGSHVMGKVILRP
jgi:hypothetical protein